MVSNHDLKLGLPELISSFWLKHAFVLLWQSRKTINKCRCWTYWVKMLFIWAFTEMIQSTFGFYGTRLLYSIIGSMTFYYLFHWNIFIYNKLTIFAYAYELCNSPKYYELERCNAYQILDCFIQVHLDSHKSYMCHSHVPLPHVLIS